MRLFEFTILLEYNREITKKNFGDKLLRCRNIETGKQDSDLDYLLRQLETIDPTPNKQYMQWLVRNYINHKFRMEDGGRMMVALLNYQDLKPRLPVEQRDINKFDLHSLEELVDNILNPDIGKPDKLDATGTYPVVPNSEVLYNGPLGQLAIPETEEASCELGRGTKWCTAAKKDNMFNAYNDRDSLYIWRDRNGKKYQFYFNLSLPQFMNDKDQALTPDQLNYFRTKNPVTSKLFKEKENNLLKKLSGDDAEYALLDIYNYALRVLKGRWPEAEPYIKKDDEIWENYKEHFNIKPSFPS